MRNFALSDEEVRHITDLRAITKPQRDAIMDAVELLARKHRPLRSVPPRVPVLRVIRTVKAVK